MSLRKEKQTRWVLGMLLVLLGIGYTWATWNYFTKLVLGGNDFIAHYTVWEAYFHYGYSPYSDEAAVYTQQAIYGRPALPGEDQNRLTYPFYSFLVHAPFILFEATFARALYMTLLQAALIVGVVMNMALVKWRPPLWLWTVVIAWSVLYYPEARGIILGQFAIFGYFSLVCALYLLNRQKDGWAGLVLVLSTVKPTLVFLALPFLFLWALSRRRWRFLGVFGLLMGGVILGSFLILPTWFGEWIYRMRLYTDYTVGQSPAWLLTHQAFPALGGAGEMVIVALLLAGMLFAWRLALRPAGADHFHWALGVTLVVSNLIVPRSATTNYVLMLATIVWVFAALDRSPGWGRPLLLGVVVASFAGLWWLHFATVIGNQEQAIMFIPPPVILGLVLIFGYRWLLDDARRQQLAF